MLRGFAEHDPIPLQPFQGLPQSRDLIGRESTQEVVFEHVMLSEHSMAVKLVEDCRLIPRNVPQASRNHMRKYKYSPLTLFTQV